MRFKTVLKIVAAFFVIFIIGVALILKSMDFNEYRGLIAEQVKAATGRELTLKGDVNLKISLSPALAINDVSFANAPWGSRPEMMKLKRLDIKVELIPLLSGNIQVKRLVLIEPDILLETDSKGTGNWVFGEGEKKQAEPEAPVSESGSPAAIPLVNEIRIKKAALTYRDGQTQKTMKVVLDKLKGRATDLNSPLLLNVSGSYNDLSFTVKSELGSVSQLTGGTAPYPVNIQAEAAGLSVVVKGTVKDPMQGKGLDLNLLADSSDLTELLKIAEASLPVTGPLHIEGRVTDPKETYSIKNLQVKLGKTSLAGSVTANTKKDRPEARVDLSSLVLDLDELSSAKGEEKPASAEISAAGKKEGGTTEKRIFSDEPLPLEGLRVADAQLKVQNGKVISSGIQLTDLALDLNLNNGVLAIRSLKGNLGGGTISADVNLNGRQSSAALKTGAKMRGVDVGQLLKDMKITDLISSGKVDFDVNLQGKGKSVRSLMAGLNGRLNMVMGEGQVETKYLNFLASDLIKLLIPGKVNKDHTMVNCMVCRFDIKNGLASSKGILLDTDEITVAGEGKINLADETLGLLMKPKPKQASLVSLAMDIRIKGTMAEPSIQPDAASVAKGVAGAVLGVMMGPAGLLIPLVSKGTGDKNPCLEALAKGPRSGSKQQPAATEQQPVEKKEEGVGGAVKGLFKGLGL